MRGQARGGARLCRTGTFSVPAGSRRKEGATKTKFAGNSSKVLPQSEFNSEEEAKTDSWQFKSAMVLSEEATWAGHASVISSAAHSRAVLNTLLSGTTLILIMIQKNIRGTPPYRAFSASLDSSRSALRTYAVSREVAAISA